MNLNLVRNPWRQSHPSASLRTTSSTESMSSAPACLSDWKRAHVNNLNFWMFEQHVAIYFFVQRCRERDMCTQHVCVSITCTMCNVHVSYTSIISQKARSSNENQILQFNVFLDPIWWCQAATLTYESFWWMKTFQLQPTPGIEAAAKKMKRWKWGRPKSARNPYVWIQEPDKDTM